MKNILRPSSLAGFLALLLLAACGGDSSPDRSGVPQVDSVIDVVESGDRAALRNLIQFVSIPCTTEPGSGASPRCQGEPAGTNVEVFQANECEQGWLREDAIDPFLEQVVALEPAVYAAFNTPDAFYLQGAYAVIFEGDDPRVDEKGLKRYMSVGIEGDNGMITGIALGCGIDEPVHFLLPHQNEGFDDYLIEPK